MHSIPPLTLQPQAVQHACQVTEVMRKNVPSGETPFRRAMPANSGRSAVRTMRWWADEFDRQKERPASNATFLILQQNQLFGWLRG